MTASFASLKSHFADWNDWEPNPILVKELRQAVRSRILTSLLMFFLMTIFLTSVGSLVGQNSSGGEVVEMGRNMFDACLTVLAVSSLVVIPVYTGIRVALDQHQENLILYTPLPVTKLVQGKLLCGVYIAGLFYSVCVPFMTFSNLLRGIDWLTIQFVLFVLFIAICVAILAAIAVAVLPVPVLVKLACGVAFVGALVLVCDILMGFFFGVVRSGISPSLKSPSFYLGFAALFGLAMFGAIIAYNLSISYITTSSPIDDSPDYVSIGKSSHDKY